MLVSRDGHSALVQFNVRGDMMQTMERVAPVLRSVAGVQKSHEGFRVAEFGTASFGKAAEDSAGKDFSHAEILAIRGRRSLVTPSNGRRSPRESQRSSSGHGG